MTRANDIANLVDANGDVVAGALDNVPPSNDASALTTGTLAAARLASNSIPRSVLTGNPLSITRYSFAMWSGITTASSSYYYGNYDLQPQLSSNTCFIIFSVEYMHNGAVDHGYLSGWCGQYGEAENDTTKQGYWTQNHFDWYYNVFEKEIWIPWNASGDTRLRFYVSAAHNSNSNNVYKINLKGVVNK